MKAVVAAFNQEKALVGAFLRDCTTSPINRFAALLITQRSRHKPGSKSYVPVLAVPTVLGNPQKKLSGGKKFIPSIIFYSFMFLPGTSTCRIACAQHCPLNTDPGDPRLSSQTHFNFPQGDCAQAADEKILGDLN